MVICLRNHKGGTHEPANTRRRLRRGCHLRSSLPGNVRMSRDEATARCRADDFRRKLVGLVGRSASKKYAIDPCELGGFVRVVNRLEGRTLWLRVRGRPSFRYVEPTLHASARLLATPDELRQLRREALTYYKED